MKTKIVVVKKFGRSYTTHTDAKRYGCTNYHYWNGLPMLQNGMIAEVVKEIVVNNFDNSYILKDYNGIEYIIGADGVEEVKSLPKEYIIFVGKTNLNSFKEAYSTLFKSNKVFTRSWNFIIFSDKAEKRAFNLGETVEDHILEKFQNLPVFTFEQWNQLYKNSVLYRIKLLNEFEEEFGKKEEEFKLPVRWCVKVHSNLEFSNVLEYLGSKGGDFSGRHHKSYKPFPKYNEYFIGYSTDGSQFYHNIHRSDHGTIITYEEFKKYVLKEQVMEEVKKEIIGYKLKENCRQYEEAVKTTTGYTTFDYINGLDSAIIPGKNCYDILKKSGLLDIWFEPVFEKRTVYKKGDYIIFYDLPGAYSQHNGDVVKITDIRYDSIHEHWFSHYPNSFSGGGFGFKPYKDKFRIATDEEVTKSRRKEYILSNGKVVVITIDGIHVENKLIPISDIKNVLALTSMVASWKTVPNEFTIGCWEQVKRVDLEAIVNIYNSL